jgi:hypothetical protein
VEIKILKPGQILKLDCKYIIVDRPIKTLNLLTYIILDILKLTDIYHLGYTNKNANACRVSILILKMKGI